MAAQGAERVMIVGAYRPTVQKCVWTNVHYSENKRSWKDCRDRIKMGLPRVAIYRVCQYLHRDKETTKRKAESER